LVWAGRTARSSSQPSRSAMRESILARALSLKTPWVLARGVFFWGANSPTPNCEFVEGEGEREPEPGSRPRAEVLVCRPAQWSRTRSRPCSKRINLPA
jgi:hypothetical protein